MMFPTTPEEYAALAEQGKAVEYAESADSETPPEGAGWQCWSDCVTPEGVVAVWRRIVSVETVE